MVPDVYIAEVTNQVSSLQSSRSGRAVIHHIVDLGEWLIKGFRDRVSHGSVVECHRYPFVFVTNVCKVLLQKLVNRLLQILVVVAEIDDARSYGSDCANRSARAFVFSGSSIPYFGQHRYRLLGIRHGR